MVGFKIGTTNHEECLKWIAAVDHGSFLDLDRNGFYKAAEHKYRKSRTKSEVDHPDVERCVQFQLIRRLGQRKHYHLERYDHGKDTQIIDDF